MSLARRSINSVAWNSVANLFTLPIGLIQSILLARLLPVEYFGIHGGVLALMVLINQLFEFGLATAFLHRSPETEDEGRAVDVLFTLRFILYTLRFLTLLALGLALFSELRQMVLVVLAITNYITGLINIPFLILIRRVHHRRIAIYSFTNSLLVAIVSVAIAYFTGSIWALLIAPVITTFNTFLFLYVWRPIWRPRFVWDVGVMKYYLRFGGRAQVTDSLKQVLDKIDDLWTNIALGDIALGYYSRAYKFATYPRLVLAAPVDQVAMGTYTELKHDRGRLSKAFFRVNALMVRTGFLLGGWLFVIAPEFILIFLGERWLPMLDAFRLMLFFTLFDPLKDTIANVLVALGMPEKVIRARLVQLAVLLAGRVVLGPQFNIAGVAMAVNIMLLIGIAILLYYVRPFVDISFRRLFAAPVAALLIALGLTWFIASQGFEAATVWLIAILKTVAFGGIYILILWLWERNELVRMIREGIRLSSLTDVFNKTAD